MEVFSREWAEQKLGPSVGQPISLATETLATNTLPVRGLRRSDSETFLNYGGVDVELTELELRERFKHALTAVADRQRVIAVVPDETRASSRADTLLRAASEVYGDRLSMVVVAAGTHPRYRTDGRDKLAALYPFIPRERIQWHTGEDLVPGGVVPEGNVELITSGCYGSPWHFEINREIAKGGYDLVLSLGQVVPHEVTGMANHSKNLVIGCGGKESINGSHFISALHGMENVMGRADNVIRDLLHDAEHQIRERHNLDIVYGLTVVGAKGADTIARGLYVGRGPECFEQAALLSKEVNCVRLDAPLDRAVVYLDPMKFSSAWLGNKAIYRTRLALADNAELIVVAPGLMCFSENRDFDALIRQIGYRGTSRIIEQLSENADLRNSLSVAAHLIHGSSEGRFKVRYCTDWSPVDRDSRVLSPQEIVTVGFEWGRAQDYARRYPPNAGGLFRLFDEDGKRVCIINDPSQHLWHL